MTEIVLNGNAYSDDGSAARDMTNGGHRLWLLPMLADAMAQIAAPPGTVTFSDGSTIGPLGFTGALAITPAATALGYWSAFPSVASTAATNLGYAGIQSKPTWNASGAGAAQLYGFLAGGAVNPAFAKGGTATFRGYSFFGPGSAGALLDSVVGFSTSGINNGGATAGTINNYGCIHNAITGAAAAGGAQNNIGTQIVLGTGSGAGTTINYGLNITGNGGSGGSGTTKNYPIYSSSTAVSYMAAAISNTGGDYAENRRLIPALYGAVAPGALLGYDAGGLMTNVYANVVGRVLPKSTSPSYIGNDIRGQEAAIVADYGLAAPGEPPVAPDEPVPVRAPGAHATDAEVAAYAAYLAAEAAYAPVFAAYQVALAAYQARAAAYETALDAEAVKWDIIALCGVVPVNVTGLTAADVGKYLVPCAAGDGTITATVVAKADLTLGQYVDSFGTVELIGADGRPMVNVKCA